MSLYVRLMTNFFTHRKTVRLRALIGNDALWIPPRLWSYAAENQPDGIFKDYTPDELAILIGYEGDASSMLQALLQARFMDPDPLRIHDWQEHNAYHQGYSERARKAAHARWNKTSPHTPLDKTGKEIERKGKEPSIASSMLGASPPDSASLPTGRNPNGADLIRRETELERVEKRMKEINDNYDSHQDMRIEHKVEMKKLKERREILKKILGFVA